jgi:hypothetical protein
MLFCRLTTHASVDWKWMLAACLLIAVFGSAAMMRFVLPTESTPGSPSFGFRLASQPTASQVLQFVLPLAICAWALRGQLRTFRPRVTA